MNTHIVKNDSFYAGVTAVDYLSQKCRINYTLSENRNVILNGEFERRSPLSGEFFIIPLISNSGNVRGSKYSKGALDVRLKIPVLIQCKSDNNSGGWPLENIFVKV